MRETNRSAARSLDVTHDRVSMWIENEVKSLHKVLAKRHWANVFGRKILDRVIESCLEELLSTDVPGSVEPPIEDFESKWAAAILISEHAAQARTKLETYTREYVAEAKWYLKPFLAVEAFVCGTAIKLALNDAAQLYDDLKRRGELQVRR